MLKQLISIWAVLSLLVAVPVAAAPKAKFEVPGATAGETVVPLGQKVDKKSGKLVEGFAFIHYKDEAARPIDKPAKGGGNTCYAYLAKDAKWKTVEAWVMNTANASSLDGTTLFANQAANLTKWEDAADGVVGNSAGVNIFGDGVSTSTTLVADTAAPDGQNEVYFADIANGGVIAVTIVWGIFGGPSSGRELVEWDQVYDDVDFPWSSSGEAGKMDFENIATHEDGHSAGMGHPNDTCTEETMYRFAGFGETKKRTLNTGDINGINTLY